jgi:ubiquinone biosynthesis protein
MPEMISLVSAVRDLGRLREISTVLVRHGFGEIVMRMGLGRRRPAGKSDAPSPASDADSMQSEGSKKVDALVVVTDAEIGVVATSSTAERVRLVLQDLGPSFIKLGQIASTRQDLVPPDIIAELKKLQDNVPAVPAEEIRRVIEESLAAPVSQIFVSFSDTPLATASIGQVHRAVLRTEDGDQEVVVKVQRPGVGATVVRDLELLHMLAAAIERAIPESKIYSPVGLVQQFDRSITSELNFAVEAENGERLTKNFEGNETVRFAKVYRQASSKQVLTQEFFAGKKIDRAMREGANGSLIAKRSVGIVIKMIFEDGFFHADPHPGNIILLGSNDAPVIGLIDLGMVGRLSPELRDRTVDLMLAAVRKDPYGVADALYAIGRPTKKVDMREYRSDVALLAEKYIGKPLEEIEISSMIRDLVQAALRFGIEIPPDFMLVGKSLMTIEGIGKQLDPKLDVFSEAQPHFLRIVKQRYSPERLGNELWRGVEQLSRAGYDLPMQLREVLDDLRLGRLTLRMEDTPKALAIDRASRRASTGLSVAGLTVSGAYLMGQHMLIAAAVLWALAGLLWASSMLRRK